MAYNPQAPNVFTYAGNPNGNVAGAIGVTNGAPPDFCWNITAGMLYVCTTTGSTSTAVWTQIPSLANPGAWTGNQYSPPTTLTDAATVAWAMSGGNAYEVQLGGNRTLGVPTAGNASMSGSLDVIQDTTGSRTLAYSWCYTFAGGTAPTLTTTALGDDVLSFKVLRFQSATVSCTSGASAVVTYTGHGLKSGDFFQFSGGTQPTGTSLNTTYWVHVIDANTFYMATSKANAAAGTYITTSSTGASPVITAINVQFSAAKDFR